MTYMKASSIPFTVWFWVFVAVIIIAVTLVAIFKGPSGLLGMIKGIPSLFLTNPFS